jgi:hypothetical protein
MFRLLWLVPGPDVDAYAAAALADLPLIEAEGALEDLVEQSLLLQSAVGRYRMHTLVRDCARELSEQHDTDTDRDLARHRLLDYYLHFADIRCLPLGKGPLRFRPDVSYPPVRLPVSRSEAENIEQLTAEQGNLLAAARFAAENGWDTHAWQLPCVLLPFFGRINSLAGSLATYRSALRAARSLGDRHGQSVALANIALAVRAARTAAGADRV